MNIPRRHLILPLIALGLAGGLPGCVSQKTPLDYYLQGQLQAQQGHLDAAIADFSVALERNPKMALAYSARARQFKAKGDYQSAASDLENATTLEPYNFHNHLELGVIYQYLQRLTDAVRAYKKAIELRPDDPEANMNLGVVYAEMGQSQTGLPYAQRAVNNDPRSPQAHANLGTVYFNAGLYDLAVAEFKRSLELDGNQPATYLNLATVYFKINDLQSARQVLQTARDAAPSAEISERLGFADFKLGRFDPARRAYEDALARSPSHPPALNGLGVVYMTQSLQASPPDVGLAHLAISEWKKSLAVDANQPVIRQLLAKYTPE